MKLRRPRQAGADPREVAAMKLQYVIDGYNLLHHVRADRPRRGRGNLQRARAALLAWIANRVDDQSCVTVVFDAPSDTGPGHNVDRRDAFGIAVLFARGYANADALIAELCRKHSDPKQLVVVSDDREVQQSARRTKARPVGCASFERHLQRRTVQRSPAPEKPIGPTDAERQHWLEVFRSQEDPVNGDASALSTSDVRSSTIPAREGPSESTPPPGDRGPDGPTGKQRRTDSDEFDYWLRVFGPRVQSCTGLDDFYHDMRSYDPRSDEDHDRID